MATKVNKPPVTQYSVAVRATFLGCSALVSATSIGEARKKAKEGIFLDGIDMKSAELVDWEIQSIGYFTPYASADKQAE